MKLILSMFLVIFPSLKTVSSLPRQDGEIQSLEQVKDGPYKMPEACKGQTYCHVKGDDYPDEDDIFEVLAEYGLFDDSIDEEIAHRQSDEGNFHCRGKYSNDPIYYIVDEQNMTRAVIQLEHYYIQTLEIRACNEGGPKDCTEDILTSLRVKSICENNYMSFDFQVISTGTVLTMETAKAKIPVCCKCRYQHYP